MVWIWRAALLWGGVSVDYLYRALDTRADHLLVGCLMAVLLRTPRACAFVEAAARLRWLAPLLVVALFASSKLDAVSPVYKYCLGYTIEPLMIALLIPLVVLASKRRSAMARIIEHPAMVEIGRVSYGIYLFHGVIMFTALRIVEAMTGSFTLALITALLAVVGCASVSFRWFEMPLRRLIAGRPSRLAAA